MHKTVDALSGGSGYDGPDLVSALMALPADPYFDQQWHLANSATGELDLNVTEVWESYRGSGIDIFVIDDGFDYAHPDLAPNYDIDRDYDYEGDDANPFGVSSNAHGTATMGLAGAAANESGVVGVAYEATLVGYRVYAYVSDSFIEQVAAAIRDAADDEADVVNMSLGTLYSSTYFDGSLDSALMADLAAAIDEATDGGRDGLGTILVKAAGNGRELSPPHNANASSWNANFKTISVAALDADGQVASYSTPGANLLVSAFGSSIPGSVVTADRRENAGYTNEEVNTEFNGTSAATPMVTGVVALMLEANPDLGWRDVQDILAYSARQLDGVDWVWNGTGDWNGGGLHHSVDTGFGLVDAFAAVRLAETWETQRTSANFVEHAVDGLDTPAAVPDADPDGLTVTVEQDATVGRVEFVTLTLALPHTRTGDLIITLTSPSGTTTTLLDTQGGLTNHPDLWTYTAAAFRGEEAAGTWTVTIVDQFSGRAADLSDLVLTVHGSAPDADDTYVFTEAFSELAGQSGHVTLFEDQNGGVDVINAAAVTADASLFLDLGYGLIDGVTITVSGIEDAATGDGDDSLVGNGTDNRFTSGRGDDQQQGGSGADRLYGGSGNDTLRGEQDDDSLFGGSMADELLAAAGDDLVWGGDGFDQLGGGSGADLLWGGSGEDRLNGGSGSDTVTGGSGNDTFIVEDDGDFIVELAGEGTEDVVRSNAAGYTLTQGAEVERANINAQAGNASLTGNSGANLLLGNSFTNLLVGASGSDTLNGAPGSDSMIGGLGHDTYVVDTVGDLVVELAGEGSDLLRALVDIVLPDNVEDLRLQSGPGFGGGNALDNSLEGNDSANLLSGASGNDRISGELGDDTLVGGSGSDLLEGGSGADSLFLGAGDSADGGSGADFYFLEEGSAAAILSFAGLLSPTAAPDKLAFASGQESGLFSYVGDALFDGGGNSQARYAGGGLVEVDRDGDGASDLSASLAGVSLASQLTAADFLWL